MAGATEAGAEVVQVILRFLPSLRSLPVIGRILVLFAGGDGGGEFQDLERAEALANKRKTERKTRIERNGRYVIKASDAMQCVEDNLNTGNMYLAIGKGVINAVGGLGYNDATEILNDRIFTCIESKVLKQTGKRVKKDVKYFGRPAKGHGHGRKLSVDPGHS